MLISVQSEDYGTHTGLVAVIAPHGLGTEVFVDEVDRVDLMEVEHVVQQLRGVLEWMDPCESFYCPSCIRSAVYSHPIGR